MADLETGERRPTREWLEGLLEELGGAAALAGARALIERGGYARQRSIAAERGLPGLGSWLADAFAPGPAWSGRGAGT